jgi:MoxR-like ATPase
MEGRYNVSFDDVESVAYPVLRHRILLSFDAVSDNVTEDKIITGIIQKLGTQNG